MSRLRRALRTNSTQARMVALLTGLNVLAYLTADGRDLWVLVVGVAFWPTTAFIFNLIDPIPEKP